jgi:alkyldihydroxyacetonephosphate synthase
VRAITPAGDWESRRLPGSGAGPSPDRMLIGSEGILGVITEAWVRLQARPAFRSSASVRFATFEAGAGAVRELSQSGLEPANCRLLEGREAMVTGAATDDRALLVLGFESADHELRPWMDRALAICAGHGGEWDGVRERKEGDGGGSGGGDGAGDGDAAAGWRAAFLAAPYVRDTMIAAGVFSETFETAITWDRLDGFVAEVRERAQSALREISGAGTVTCRFTHVYPDGAAPYFTMLAPAVRGGELEQWDAVKAAASDAVIAAGGTITHHHAVGRDHRPWYDRQRPDAFARALRAAKRELDPAGILNPGVLIDP